MEVEVMAKRKALDALNVAAQAKAGEESPDIT